MPSYEVLVDGRPRRIELARASQTSFTGKMDGKGVKVEVEEGRVRFGQAFTLQVDGETYKIELPKAEHGKMIPVKVNEASFRVEVTISGERKAMISFEPTTAAARKTGANRKVVVEGAVAAPMTGKIVNVKVKKGDQVKANQVLCIIEAMKMENEITAPKAGTIQEMNVTDGMPVNEGEILFMLS
jgi:biotin carboxyl carrier protein